MRLVIVNKLFTKYLNIIDYEGKKNIDREIIFWTECRQGGIAWCILLEKYG